MRITLIFWSVSIETDPRNLSLVLHQLTKAPSKPVKEASLKHLTLKTIFRLALGSGKHRSEIDAWQNKNIRNQSHWSKVSLYPTPFFPRTSWQRRVHTVWPQWLSEPWPQLWITPSIFTGPYVQSEHCSTTWTGPQTSGRTRTYVQSEHCGTTWTGPQTSGRTRSCFLFLSRKILPCHHLFMDQTDCDSML